MPTNLHMISKLPGRLSWLDVLKRVAKAKGAAKAKAAKVVVRNSAVKQQAAMSTKKSLTV